MRSDFDHCYILSTGHFLPGAPVDNESMDRYIGSINARSQRLKARVLRENGIISRHYALDENGRSLFSVANLGARALHDALSRLPEEARGEIDLLAAATTGGDVVVPGFANMLQGEMGLPPMKTASLSGVCAAGISAMDYACRDIERGAATKAAVVASEFPSRLFKATRFNSHENTSFDAHFLRWMLSDGAGALIMGPQPSRLSLKVNFVFSKSFSGDYGTCMQAGMAEGNKGAGYLDFESLAEAEKLGAFFLRQDIKLLPNLFDVGIHEYARLVREGWFTPEEIDHFLCHYSSERFRPMIQDLMSKADLTIPPERWFSNLATRGNTGSASIFIMLDEFMRKGRAKPGDKLLLFIPESGRFTVAFVGLEVVQEEAPSSRLLTAAAPIQPTHANPHVANTLRELLQVWHDYRSAILRTTLARRIEAGEFSAEDYRLWMENWIPQVREGSVWMRKAIAHLPQELAGLRSLIEEHAGEEQYDFRILYKDYQAAGGLRALEELRRNPGGEALNAYMHAKAASPQSFALLGGIYIIEGTGQRIIATLLPRIKAQVGLPMNAFRFLEYHGENDVRHLKRWLSALELVIAASPTYGARIVQCARDVSALYSLQWATVSNDATA